MCAKWIVLLLLAHAVDSLATGRLVFSQYILGNTHAYDKGREKWSSPEAAFEWDIRQAIDAGLDGFNIAFGDAYWEKERLLSLYKAADKFDDFKLFVNIDMTKPMNQDSKRIIEIYNWVSNHSSQFKISNKKVLGVYKAQYLKLDEASDIETAWKMLIDKLDSVYFMPHWDLDAERLVGFSFINGIQMVKAWPYKGDDPFKICNESEVSYSEDRNIIELAKNRPGDKKTIMSSVSPGLFKHFNSEESNLIHLSENTWHRRWQQILENDCDLVQVFSWNDFGASNAVGPVNTAASFPDDAEKWTVNMDHEVFYKMLPFYIQWFKAGKGEKNMPKIHQEAIFFYHRTHFKDVTIDDPLGKPKFTECAKDVFVIHSLLNEDVTFEITIEGDDMSGNNSQSQNVTLSAKNGLDHHEVDFFTHIPTGKITTKVIRNNKVVPGSEMYPTVIWPPEKLQMYNFNFVTRVMQF